MLAQVDDTVSGVGEGLSAGCWSVGVAGLSNYTDIDSMQQWEAMSPQDKEKRVSKSRYDHLSPS
jgi:phosphonoacetaldehyde hydrolase